MNTTYSITRAQAKFPGIVREARLAPVRITRHDETVAYVISKQRMDAIKETLELLANPEAMAALRAARDREVHYVPLHESNED